MEPYLVFKLPIQSILWWIGPFLVKKEIENVLMISECQAQGKNPYQGLPNLGHRVCRRTSSTGNNRTKSCGLCSSNSEALILWYSLVIVVTFVFLTICFFFLPYFPMMSTLCLFCLCFITLFLKLVNESQATEGPQKKASSIRIPTLPRVVRSFFVQRTILYRSDCVISCN